MAGYEINSTFFGLYFRSKNKQYQNRTSMSKEKSSVKEKKKEPAKTLKEKKADKVAKKKAKRD
ncbi:hypothetical protein D770_06885 [Flammeovirgaceae bacterium 311]|nr:hypothetical protein D770_06885 [Flammeovirgaceae bacterium 311]